MISAKMQEAFEQAYADARVSPAELIHLRNTVDEAAEKVLAEEGREGALDALCKSFDVTAQLLQDVALRTRSGEYSDLGRAMVRSVIEAQTAFLNATARAFE
jgi:predicted RecB family endonuclease